MKILLCSVSLALGGVERRMVAEAKLLGRLGHDVTVATPRFSGMAHWKNSVQASGASHWHWYPYKFIERKHWAMPFRCLTMASLPSLRRRQFDFVRLSMPWSSVGLSMAYLLSHADIPFILSVHAKFDSRKLSFNERKFTKQALRRMVGGYAVSQTARDHFMRLYGDLLPDSIELQAIHNGIDTQHFRPDVSNRHAIRRRLGISDESLVVLFCGRLDELKRPRAALQAFARFATHRPDATLLVVGDGPEGAAVEQEKLSLGAAVADRVVMVGQVPDTAPYYAASDVYLSTSQTEAFSQTLAEGLASGLPAVVPDDDVHREIYGACDAVQHCARSVPSAWDAALNRIARLDDASYSKLATQARAYAQVHLSEKLMEKNLTMFYDNIFAGLNASREKRSSV